MTKISKESDVTQSHTFKLLKLARRDGLVVFAKRDCRSKSVHLTVKGEAIRNHYISILTIINEGGKND